MAKYIIRLMFLAAAAVLSFNMVNTVAKAKFENLKTANVSNPAFDTVRDKNRQLACMTQNIYWEAASEPPEGKLAVAQVVMNRVESGQFPNDACAVIYQKNVIYQKVICQFSWVCEKASTTRPIHKQLWQESQDAAKMVLYEGFRLPSLKGVMYYHADYVNPNWGMKKTTQIGRHIFYKKD
jgi:spore germination cell wall hydrolase CwlJ-like protein